MTRGYACSLALALGSCAFGRLVSPDDAVRLGTSDALVALDVDVRYGVTLTLCRDADYASCLETRSLTTEQPLQLYQVPAGTYCLLSIAYGVNATQRQRRSPDPDYSDCMILQPSVINDPGVLVIVPHATPTGPVGVDMRWEPRPDIAGRIDAQYPDLAAMPVVTTPVIVRHHLTPH